MKEEKELKPASMRVRDAAENLLTSILEQVSYFPSECGPESISSLLDELSLLKHCNSWPTHCNDHLAAVEKFRYFVTEGSVMLALLEEPLGNDQVNIQKKSLVFFKCYIFFVGSSTNCYSTYPRSVWKTRMDNAAKTSTTT